MKGTKEKELTLEIPLEELQEVREIWYGVCAFNHMLHKLDGDEDDQFALRQFHKPLRDRFTHLLAGEPAWDQRMGEVETESEGLANPEADKPTKRTITQEVQIAVGNLDELGYAIEEVQAVYAELRKSAGLEQLPVSQQGEEGGAA